MGLARAADRTGGRRGSRLLARLGDVLATTPLRMTAVYLALGFAALLLSDWLLVQYLSDPVLSRIQTLKAGFEVLLTAGLILLLTTASRAMHRETTAELERHREELRVLHRLLRHNLRNDLNVVQGEAERLREGLDEAEHVRACDTILDATRDIVEYAERARAIRKLTERGSRELDLVALLRSFLAEPDALGDDVEVTLDLPERAPVLVNELFPTALAELLENAATHAGDAPQVSVTVDPDAGPPGRTLLEVRDDGPGLPAHAEAVLRGEERDQLVHMDGLGLWLAYLTVVESGGEFVIPEDAPGTTVRAYLPTADGTRHGSGWSVLEGVAPVGED